MKRPLVITVWSVICLLSIVYLIWASYAISQRLVTDWSKISWANWAPLVVMVALMAALVFSFWKMSRLPAIIFLAGIVYTIVGAFFINPTWDVQFWVVGVIAPLVFAVAFIVTVLPHWKNMTWSPLGRRDFGSPKGAH